MTRFSMLMKAIGAMNRAYDRDSRKLFRRIRKYLERLEVPISDESEEIEEKEILDQIELLLGDREPPFDMDDKT